MEENGSELSDRLLEEILKNSEARCLETMPRTSTLTGSRHSISAEFFPSIVFRTVYPGIAESVTTRNCGELFGPRIVQLAMDGLKPANVKVINEDVSDGDEKGRAP